MSIAFSTPHHRQATLWTVDASALPRLPAMRRSFAVCLVCPPQAPAWIRQLAMARAANASRVEAVLIIQPGGALRVVQSASPAWPEGSRLSPSVLHWIDDAGRDVPPPTSALPIPALNVISAAAGA